MQVSLKALESMEQRARTAATRVKRIQEEAHDTVMAVVTSVETFGTTFSFGVINGRWGNPELMGVPVDLGVGILMHGLAFILDDGAEHLHAIGNGALCSYFAGIGVGIGGKMLQEAKAAAAKLAAASP